jgi:hypothetical protein
LILLTFCAELFRPALGHETILLGDETIFRFWRRTPETPDRYQLANNNGGQRRRAKPERELNAIPQLHPWLRFRPGWSLIGRFVGQ